MSFSSRTLSPVGACVAALATLAGSFAVGQPSENRGAERIRSVDRPTVPDTQPEIGAGESACVATMPGDMHRYLQSHIGVWNGKTQMWMGPGTQEPMRGECTWTITSLMEGRYIQCEMQAEMPGMGTFTGRGVSGFDVVTHKFVGTWIDNHSTGIMNGVGELDSDGVTLNWTYTYNCPIRKHAAVVRQVETSDLAAGTRVFEMFTTDLQTGTEYRCMRIDFTRKP